ncbi:hypothetical protein B0H11DRAFT_2285823 [Mycena galericulata]|nr:hypothetical protein B0H11DRAFT_2285823 [Mycena galericulata]
MPPPALQLAARAEALCTFCETTPGMNALQPTAASAVEICTAAATLVGNDAAAKLAGYVVNQIEFLINGFAQVPLSPEICQALAIHEEKLDAIRRHFENMPAQPGKRFFSTLKFKRETNHLKKDLKSHLRVIVAICDGKSFEAKGALRSEDILEYVSVGARAVGAICDAPVLDAMKPVVGVINLICETAKCVRSNREAALDISARARAVTRSIVERAAMDGAAVPDPEALNSLKLALEDIQSYLTALKKPRRRLSSWFLANQEKDQFAKLDGGLDKAVALFSVAQTLRTAEEVHVNTNSIDVNTNTINVNTRTIAALEARVGRLDTKLTVIQADFGRLSETPVHHKNNSFRSIFTPSNVRLTFFFRSVKRELLLVPFFDGDHQKD